MGSDSYKLMLIFGWVVTEGVLCWLGIPAEHYTENQIQIFDLYQNRLVELGESGGVGEDWSPMTWIAVMSVVNAAILIGLNKYGNGDGAATAMRGVSTMITGKSAVAEDGTPIPEDQQTAPNPLGDLLNSFAGGGAVGVDNPLFSMAGKFGPQLLSMFTGGVRKRAETKKTPGGARKPRARPTFT
jgi:hypothetical protein